MGSGADIDATSLAVGASATRDAQADRQSDIGPRASPDLAGSESEQRTKALYFHRVEDQWGAADTGKTTPDYGLLNALWYSSDSPSADGPRPSGSPVWHSPGGDRRGVIDSPQPRCQRPKISLEAAAAPTMSPGEPDENRRPGRSVHPLSKSMPEFVDAGSPGAPSVGSCPPRLPSDGEARRSDDVGLPTAGGAQCLVADMADGGRLGALIGGGPGRRSSEEGGRRADLEQTLNELHGELRASRKQASEAIEEKNTALVEAQKSRESEGKVREFYEGHLRDKQQQLQRLKLQMRRSASGGGKGGGEADWAEESMAGEVQRYKKEMEEQEMLIRGYQAENESAVRRIKELEESVLHAENLALDEQQRLERQILQLQDERQASSAETATRLRQVLELQMQLEAVRDEAAVRETEMKERIEKLQAEKKGLEARLAGVDLQAMEKGDLLVREMKNEMAEMTSRHEALVSELRAKVAWYAENQELLDESVAAAQGQAELIGKLRSRVSQLEGRLDKESAHRVKELEQQVATLQETLASKHPNSIPAIIQAAKPAPEENDLVRELRERLKSLEVALHEKDTEYEQRLRSLGQQHEKLKLAYESQRGKGAAPANRNPQSKVAEFEKMPQLTNVSCPKKVKGQEQKQRAKNSEPHCEASGVNVAGKGTMASKASYTTLVTLRQRAEQIKKLEGLLQTKDTEIEELRQQAARPDRNPTILASSTPVQLHQATQADDLDRHSDLDRDQQKASAQEAGRWIARAEHLERALESSRIRVLDLEGQLGYLQQQHTPAPDVSDFLSLEAKISNLEDRLASQESQWRWVLDDARQTHALEMVALKSRCQALLDAKTAEVEKFRVEVGSVLHTAKVLRASQPFRQGEGDKTGPVAMERIQ